MKYYTCYNINEPQKHAEWKKSDTKGRCGGQGAHDKGLFKQGGPGNPRELRSLGTLDLVSSSEHSPVPSSWSDCEDRVNEVWTYHTHLWSGLQALASINIMQDLTFRGYSTSGKILSRVPEGHWIFLSYPSITNGPLQPLFISWGLPGSPFLHYGYLREFLCVRKTALTWHWGSQPTNAGGEKKHFLSPEPSPFGGWGYSKVHKRRQNLKMPSATELAVPYITCKIATFWHGHSAEKLKLGSSCPLTCKKCQAGRSGRKSCHGLWVLLPRRHSLGCPSFPPAHRELSRAFEAALFPSRDRGCLPATVSSTLHTYSVETVY